ncbi:hypothetical protein GALL_222900 [mine drainage metagenome]|uniref:DUF2946 domain-containing protein n=1 Tax=mine drainage metagenome TaxID=410659 RepID=A0A1J5S1S7_9ZZZZ
MQFFRPAVIGHIARVALLAILMQALTPLWGAVSGTGAAQLVEICSAAGPRLLQLDQGAHQKAPATHGSTHCPFCGGTGIAPTTRSQGLSFTRPALRYPGISDSALARPG